MTSKSRVAQALGKTRLELDLEGESGKTASKVPFEYVFHVWSHGPITSSNAQDSEKTNRLIDGLPWALKTYFVQDTPQTVHASAELP